jgi:hypothetical protein
MNGCTPPERSLPMTLQEKLRALRDETADARGESGGFQLVKPQTYYIREQSDALLSMLKTQADNVAYIDGEKLQAELSLAGEVGDTGWRLTKAAFGDLCHWTRVPVSFVKRVAKIDEQLALDMMRTMIEAYFFGGPEKLLVVDTTTGYVVGIVGKETYKAISNEDIVKWALSVGHGLALSEAWVCGPDMRITCTSEDLCAEPVKNDLIRFGMSLVNGISGDSSAKISGYGLRLVCTNGMTARTGQMTTVVRHVGDVEHGVQKGIVRIAEASATMAPLLSRAAGMLLHDKGIRQVRQFISDTKNGGNPALDNKATKIAQIEAQKEGRFDYEVTLYNFVNGVTEVARDTGNVERKVEIESLAHKTLLRYGVLVKE